MNTDILKRLDDAISSTLIGKSENPDCNVGAAICIIKDGKEVYTAKSEFRSFKKSGAYLMNKGIDVIYYKPLESEIFLLEKE